MISFHHTPHVKLDVVFFGSISFLLELLLSQTTYLNVLRQGYQDYILWLWHLVIETVNKVALNLHHLFFPKRITTCIITSLLDWFTLKISILIWISNYCHWKEKGLNNNENLKVICCYNHGWNFHIIHYIIIINISIGSWFTLAVVTRGCILIIRLYQD